MSEPVIKVWDDPATETKHIELHLTRKVMADYPSTLDLLAYLEMLSEWLSEEQEKP